MDKAVALPERAAQTYLSLRILALVRPVVRQLDWAISAGIFAAALLVFNATLTPSLSYLSPDGNELATIPYILGLAHSTGYPLYTWLGKLFTLIPVGDVAHRINLMSAVLGAAGAGLMVHVLLLLLNRLPTPAALIRWQPWLIRLTAASVSLLFAFSPSFWAQTSIAEVYAPNLFVVALQTVLILKWAQVEQAHPARRGAPPAGRSLAWFSAFCLAFALSTGTHSSNLGFGLAYAVFVLAINPRFAVSPRALLVGTGLFALGMLQHLWLPYKASTLTDGMMRAHSPDTWQGFYEYTLGAFPQFKFAFPLSQVPDRIVIYLDLLRQQFTVPGILIAIVGLAVLLWHAPRRWWLLSLMYLVHVIFFTQYRVFDLDVFFIPAHFLFALFLGIGLAWLLIQFFAKLSTSPRSAQIALASAVALILAGLPVWQARARWSESDRSQDVAINDFYLNAFDMLPKDSILLGRGGVFGYDMFYWRLVYNLRPDVLMPNLPEERVSPAEAAGRPVYTTMPLDAARGGRESVPPGYASPNAWSTPVLLGNSTAGVNGFGRQPLILYAVTDNPPDLFISHAAPAQSVDVQLAGLTLLGFDVDTAQAHPGGRLHLTLYWQSARWEIARISTALGQTELELHGLGLENLARLLREAPPQPGDVLVEDYWVTIPSTLEPGRCPLLVSAGGISVVIAEIEVGE